jgi:hypothetical protein
MREFFKPDDQGSGSKGSDEFHNDSERVGANYKPIPGENDREAVVESSEVAPAISPVEAALPPEARTEAKEKSAEDKEKISIGFNNIGLVIEESKDRFFANALEGATKDFKDKKGTAARFMVGLAATFREDAELARDKIEDIKTGRSGHGVVNSGYFLGNILKYGRIVADTVGVTAALPYRYAMLGATFFTRGMAAAKEARLTNEKVMDKTRVEDAEKAADEAWLLYDAARDKAGKEEISGKEIQKTYLEKLPADIKKRFENSKPEEKTGFLKGMVEKSAEKMVGRSVNKLDKKIKNIEGDEKLSAEQKEVAKDQLFRSYKRKIHDWERMISDYGVVDALAIGAKATETIGKAAITALSVETLVFSFEKTVSGITHLFSHSDLGQTVDAFQPKVASPAASKALLESIGLKGVPADSSHAEAIPDSSGSKSVFPAWLRAMAPDSLQGKGAIHDSLKGVPADTTGHGGGFAEQMPDRGQVVPIPDAVVEADPGTAHEVTIGKGGTVWHAAKEMGLSENEFKAAWHNPDSTLETDNGIVPISKVGLVHEGDVVKYFPGENGAPGHFEIWQGGDAHVGTDTDLYNERMAHHGKVPDWLKDSVLGTDIGGGGTEHPLEPIPLTFQKLIPEDLHVSKIEMPADLKEFPFFQSASGKLEATHEYFDWLDKDFDQRSLDSQEGILAYVDKATKEIERLEQLNLHGPFHLNEEQLESLREAKEAAKKIHKVYEETFQAFKDELADRGVSYDAYEKAVAGKGLRVSHVVEMLKNGELDKKWEPFAKWIVSMKPTGGALKLTADSFLRSRFTY